MEMEIQTSPDEHEFNSSQNRLRHYKRPNEMHRAVAKMHGRCIGLDGVDAEHDLYTSSRKVGEVGQ